MTEQKERELYFWLRLIREFEDRISALDKQGKIQGGVYSGKGQEAVVGGVCHDLRPDDWIFPLHRDLGAFLVKGADPNRLMAQIFGRRDGFSKGKDSFLHGGDFSRCIFGSTSMLGSTLPVAAGPAYKFKIGKEDRGAACPGNDLPPVRRAARKAIDRARSGEGPTFLECKTYRYHGHSEHDRATYRSEEELIAWESRDPIERWEVYLAKRKYDIAAIREEVGRRGKKIVEDAVAFAEGRPVREGPEAMEDLYATPITEGWPMPGTYIQETNTG